MLDLSISIIWTVVAILNVILCATGKEPNWATVFLALIVILVYTWKDYFENH